MMCKWVDLSVHSLLGWPLGAFVFLGAESRFGTTCIMTSDTGRPWAVRVNGRGKEILQRTEGFYSVSMPDGYSQGDDRARCAKGKPGRELDTAAV